MPLQKERFNFAEERESLRDEMADVAERKVEWESREQNKTSQQRIAELEARGNQLQNEINALDWLQSEWNVDGVTLSGLTTGEVNRVEDIVEADDRVRPRIAWVAVGTNDAPYLNHKPDAITQEDISDTISEVFDLPPAYVQWAETRISDLTHLEADQGNGFGDLVQEMREEKT